MRINGLNINMESFEVLVKNSRAYKLYKKDNNYVDEQSKEIKFSNTRSSFIYRASWNRGENLGYFEKNINTYLDTCYDKNHELKLTLHSTVNAKSSIYLDANLTKNFNEGIDIIYNKLTDEEKKLFK